MSQPLYRKNSGMYGPTTEEDASLSLDVRFETLSGDPSLFGYTVVDLFGDGKQLDRMLNLALMKVLATFEQPLEAFYNAQRGGINTLHQLIDEPRTGRRDCVKEFFLPMTSAEISALAVAVAWAMPYAHKFVRKTDLLPRLTLLPHKEREVLRLYGRRLLVEEVVAALVEDNTDLWFHEGSRSSPSGWQMSSSLMGELPDLRRTMRGLEPRHPHFRKKFDRRNYHGRPNRDRFRDGPEALSTGGFSFAR